MNYLLLGLLAAACSTTALADPPSAASPAASANRTFDCGPNLRANLVLRSTTLPGTHAPAYNAVANLHVNGLASDPATLRFINDKIDARTIDAVVENCHDDIMELLFSTNSNGTTTPMLTLSVQGNKLSVQ